MLNWKRYLTISLWFIFAFFLQYGFLNNLGWGILCPQLLIFFPIFGGMLEGSKAGLICGITTGLMQDLVIGRFLGTNVLVWALIGFSIGIFSKSFFKENYLFPIVAVVLSFGASCVLYAVLVGLLSSNWISLGRLIQITMAGIFINGILAPIVYLPVYRSLSYGLLRKRSPEEGVL